MYKPDCGYDMLVSYCLQMIYLFKFYHWERGYMNSLDIILDYAGQMVSFIGVLHTLMISAGCRWMSVLRSSDLHITSLALEQVPKQHAWHLCIWSLRFRLVH